MSIDDDSLIGRTRGRAADVQARAKRLAEQAEAARGRHGSIDALYLMVDRDLEVGGGIMGGSLAYRLFVWLLPFALVVVGGIGVVSEAGSDSPESAARSLGLRGLVSDSVAEAAQGSSRWYALLIGVPVLVWATRNLLKALVVVHRLVWGDLRRVAPKATIGATLRFLVLFVCYFLIVELGRAVESWSGSAAPRVLVAGLGFFVWWLWISIKLPHRDAPWRALVPGAILVAVGLELISIFASYVLVPQLDNRQGTYGVLGIAAVLLFGLYLISRLLVAGAVVNEAIWDRRSASAQG